MSQNVAQATKDQVGTQTSNLLGDQAGTQPSNLLGDQAGTQPSNSLGDQAGTQTSNPVGDETLEEDGCGREQDTLAVNEQDGFLHFSCPHCGIDLEVEAAQVNCGIFRCGIVRSTGAQLPPHMSKQDCDALRSEENGALIWGCARPFRLDAADQTVTVCDYV